MTILRRRYILYTQWYRLLRKTYGIWDSFCWAVHNSKTHELDGSYRKW